VGGGDMADKVSGRVVRHGDKNKHCARESEKGGEVIFERCDREN